MGSQKIGHYDHKCILYTVSYHNLIILKLYMHIAYPYLISPVNVYPFYRIFFKSEIRILCSLYLYSAIRSLLFLSTRPRYILSSEFSYSHEQSVMFFSEDKFLGFMKFDNVIKFSTSPNVISRNNLIWKSPPPMFIT